MGSKEVKKTNTDAGYSLVELIVVIAILTVMTGAVSIGVSLAFSRDAEVVAKQIDGELSDMKMLAMSRDGDFVFLLNLDSHTPANNSIVIQKDHNPYKTVNMKKDVSIIVSGGGLPSAKADGTVTIVFDKSNGSVKTIDGNTSTGVCKIEVTSGRMSTKKSIVNLVATTGRHYVSK